MHVACLSRVNTAQTAQVSPTRLSQYVKRDSSNAPLSSRNTFLAGNLRSFFPRLSSIPKLNPITEVGKLLPNAARRSPCSSTTSARHISLQTSQCRRLPERYPSPSRSHNPPKWNLSGKPVPSPGQRRLWRINPRSQPNRRCHLCLPPKRNHKIDSSSQAILTS